MAAHVAGSVSTNKAILRGDCTSKISISKVFNFDFPKGQNMLCFAKEIHHLEFLKTFFVGKRLEAG